MSESNIGNKIMMAVSNIGTRLFRMNSALSWTGSRIERQSHPWQTMINPSDIVIRNARPIHSGMVGMPDYAGWSPIKILPSMVGKTFAITTWIEVKTENGKPTKEQLNFIEQVNKSGGIAFVARSEHDAIINIQKHLF